MDYMDNIVWIVLMNGNSMDYRWYYEDNTVLIIIVGDCTQMSGAEHLDMRNWNCIFPPSAQILALLELMSFLLFLQRMTR